MRGTGASSAEILPGVIADRRHLHQYPEVAFREEQTARFIAERLRALGVEDMRTGIATTGVTALIRGTGGAGPGRTALLRADIDALPIQEENEVDYHSEHPGVMHACGHDGHTAIVLAVARLLLERHNEFAGTVKLCFQPAEEAPPGGARPMIEAGVLDDPPVDAAFGLHLLQALPVGVVGLRTGAVMATGTVFYIVIRSRGGHASNPHRTVDPIAVGASPLPLQIWHSGIGQPATAHSRTNSTPPPPQAGQFVLATGSNAGAGVSGPSPIHPMTKRTTARCWQTGSPATPASHVQARPSVRCSVSSWLALVTKRSPVSATVKTSRPFVSARLRAAPQRSAESVRVCRVCIWIAMTGSSSVSCEPSVLPVGPSDRRVGCCIPTSRMIHP